MRDESRPIFTPSHRMNLFQRRWWQHRQNISSTLRQYKQSSTPQIHYQIRPQKNRSWERGTMRTIILSLLSLWAAVSNVATILMVSGFLVPTTTTFKSCRNAILDVISSSSMKTMEDVSSTEIPISPLALTFEELSQALDGAGKAKACWECFRIGVDPIWYYSQANRNHDKYGVLSNTMMTPPYKGKIQQHINNKQKHHDIIPIEWPHSQIKEYLSERSSSRSPIKLSFKTIQHIKKKFGTSIEKNIATLRNITTSQDGTTKLLLELTSNKLLVETVIIPWEDRQRSTICISSQVGCKQACTFCSTGKMGLLRNLTSSEILIQLYYANKVCRLRNMHPIDNCVFMGMGEPADNIDEVVKAAGNIIDDYLFQLSPRRVTISTVAPTPQAFKELAKVPVVLAWSVHSSQDLKRQQLVPTTKYTMSELRQGLITALQDRSKRLRNVMLEVTLIDHINDDVEDAEHLVEFCQPLLDEVNGIKLVINLIPWNDISATSGPARTYRKPRMDRILRYQKVLIENGILSYIRTTRGDEEDAACGMLSTKNNKKKQQEPKV